jgi:hypothetical protein
MTWKKIVKASEYENIDGMYDEVIGDIQLHLLYKIAQKYGLEIEEKGSHPYLLPENLENEFMSMSNKAMVEYLI